MKQALLGILLTLSSSAIFSQVDSYEFGATGGNVIAYKQGNTKHGGMITLTANPVTNNELRFTTALTSKQDFVVRSVNGGLVKTGEVICSDHDTQSISLPQLSKGVYIFHIRGAPENLKFIVQ